MRLIKPRTLAATMVLAAMGFMGATSAMAEHTALCTQPEALCESAGGSGKLVKLIHLTAGTTELKGTVFGINVTLLCLSSLILGHVESPFLAKPLGIQFLEIKFELCGTNASHNNCTFTMLTPGLIDILKTSAQLGTAEMLNTNAPVILLFCNLGILGNIHCDYFGTAVGGFTVASALHNGAGHGTLTAPGVVIPIKESLTGACPSNSTWTATYESLEHIYLST